MKHHFNYFLFFLVVFILSFSMVFLACLSASASLQKFGNTHYFIFNQLINALIALVFALIAYFVPLTFWKKWAPFLLFLNLIAMFFVFIPGIGIKAGGASRWFSIGFTSVQPSEFLKITSILYLSAWIASKLSDTNMSSWKSIAKNGYHNFVYIFAPFFVFLGVIFGTLYLQSDASTMGIITLTLLALYFSAKTPLWHTLCIIAGGLSIVLFMVKFEPYRLSRWFVFLNPDADPLGQGYQLRQSIISLGSGGFFGKGLGMSTQKFGYLPEAMTDSIFAIIGEEFGFIGTSIVVLVFILFFWLGINIAKKSTDQFSKMTAIGIVVWIILQAFINITSTIGFFPITGVPLPFFTYGGSHLVAELFAIGLLLNISKNK